MIAIHGGTSFKVKSLFPDGCGRALAGETDLISAISCLEDDPLFNCGTGSNLTTTGSVECESCYMIGKPLRFGAIGAVTNVKNPCILAKELALSVNANQLLCPQVLVGNGASVYANTTGVPLIEPSQLVTDKALKRLDRARKTIIDDNPVAVGGLDTVGGVSIENGVVEACSSSGGVVLKHEGRLGHSTTMGSAVWTDSKDDVHYASVVSGCGEALVSADFCRSLTTAVMNRDEDVLPVETIDGWFKTKFLNSPYLERFHDHQKMAGGLLLIQDGRDTELLVFHNTPFLPVAYRYNSKISKISSKLPQNSSFKCDSYLI